MPKLPEENKERDFELLDKNDFSRGALSQSKPVIIKKHLHIPVKPIMGILVVIVLLGGIYTITKTYFPDLFKLNAPKQAEVKPFEYPINTSEIKFPGEPAKQKFLENLQNAAKETDKDERYKFLEDDFTLLKVFYSQSASYDFRVQLGTYKKYMQKNYPKQVEANPILYDFPCLDKLCTDGVVPDEIKTIAAEIVQNRVLNSGVKDAVSRNFDAASFSKDKVLQANMYMGVLSMLVSEYKSTNDAQIKTICTEMVAFISRNYPEVKIPNELKL